MFTETKFLNVSRDTKDSIWLLELHMKYIFLVHSLIHVSETYELCCSIR